MGCECKFKPELDQRAYLGGVLGIKVDGQTLPINEDGTVDLTNIQDSAVLAESWAVGGTGTREGEDTDNAKYYAEMAEQQAAVGGYLFFQIIDGDLYMTKTPNVDVNFYLQDGDLYLEGM